MLYPLSYRRMGPARNVVENPPATGPGTTTSPLVGPVRRRSGLEDPPGARQAYRDATEGRASSPSKEPGPWGVVRGSGRCREHPVERALRAYTTVLLE